MSCAVEVAAFEIVRVGPAVGHVAADVPERRDEAAGLRGERVLAAAARAVQPPDLALGTFLCERAEHGENRVAPIPALIRSTGARVVSRTKLPRGAATSTSSPTASVAW